MKNFTLGELTVAPNRRPSMVDLFGVQVGLSCHTPTIYTAIASIGYGARIIEKHFTLDPAGADGPDQSSSLRPEAFSEMVDACNSAWDARGRGKFYLAEEREKLEPMRNPQ